MPTTTRPTPSKAASDGGLADADATSAVDAPRPRAGLLRRSSTAALAGILAANRAGVRWLRAGQVGSGSNLEVARWSGARR